jgi:hypothetical protein
VRARVAGLAGVVVLLAACGSGPAQVAAGPDTVSGADVGGHVHHIALDGTDLLLGTHDGVWRQQQGEVPRRVSEPPFDVMGLALTGDRMLASGHPGPDMDAPADLGLIASADGGATWQSVSLWGEVDFHRLTAAGEVVMGVAAADGALLRSEDAGESWAVLSGIPAVDVAVDPASPGSILVTTENGIASSADGGRTWSTPQDAPLLGLLAWTDGAVYGADAQGRVHASDDSGRSWSARGTLPAPPMALTADGDRVLAYADGTVVESTDGGSTFLARVTDLPG